MSKYSIDGRFYSIIEKFTAVEIDKNVNCSSWASTGECAKNPNYMLPNCPVSCRPKDESIVHVADQNYSCDVWASSGACADSSDYMLRNCPVSCQHKDKHAFCSLFASQGKCLDSDIKLKCPVACPG
jgi:hypothetical protein